MDKKKLKTVLRIWLCVTGISLGTIVVFQIVPAFGNIIGDIKINVDNLMFPIASCAFLSAIITGVFVYRNWQKL